MSAEQKSEVLKEWGESAKYWATHAETIREMFEPMTVALIDAAQIVRGQSVLDIAGGAGEPSLTIAGVVGPTGSVTCTDGAQEMVEVAQEEAKKRGTTNVNFRQCLADALPFENNSFDAVVCRLGTMFFPDPLAALKEMLRVLKPGGRVALVVWDKNEVNPFFSIPSEVVSRYAPSEPGAQNTSDAFRFAELGQLLSILQEAGAIETGERVLKFDMTASIPKEDYWTSRSQTSDSLRQKLSTLSESDKAKIASEVNQAMAEYFPGDQMKLPAQVLVISGTK